MRVLVVDPISPPGHKGFNNNFLRLISKLSEVTFICREGYLGKSNLPFIKDCKFIPNYLYSSNRKLSYRVSNIKVLNWLLKNINFSEYDVVILTSFETISFSIMSTFMGKVCKPIYIINHNNVDELQNKYKKFFYKKINRHITQVYLSDFIKEYINQELDIKNDKHIVNHPVEEILGETNYIKDKGGGDNKDNIFIFSPSGSSDEEFINTLIKAQKENKLLSKNRIKMYIKSKVHSYKDDYLEVGNSYLQKEKYDKYMYAADYIFLFYSKRFNYRISAVYLESILKRKKIICSQNEFFVNEFKKCPQLGFMVKDFKDFQNILQGIYKVNTALIPEEQLDNLYYSFSDKYILTQLERILVKHGDKSYS